MKKLRFLFPFLLFGCISEDIVLDEVDPIVQFTNPISSLEVNTFYQFEYMFLDDVGATIDPISVSWLSSDEALLTVDDNGLVRGLNNGTVTLSISAILNELAADTSISFDITGDATMTSMTERTGSVQTTSSYVLKGDFALSANDDDLFLAFGADYVADNGLPGLFVYLSNNPNTIAGAHEIGAVTTFSGAHEYDISNVNLFDYNYVLYYCKPFNVKVGHGTIQ